MKTLEAVRVGFCDDLISRVADFSLKEGRKLMMVVRETPLSEIHLDKMLALRRVGAIIFPPVPAFYTKPTTGVDDLIYQIVGRLLEILNIHTQGFKRWSCENVDRGSSWLHTVFESTQSLLDLSTRNRPEWSVIAKALKTPQ
jgi:3-polyprenyl-4-hydroxybenzoate decarboxylase